MADAPFIGQDYLNAASNFGGSIGSGILGTLNTVGNTAGSATNVALSAGSNLLSAGSDVANQTGGYLSSLVNGSANPTINNPSTSSPASIAGKLGSVFNLSNLGAGVSNLKTPNMLGAISNSGNGLSASLNNFGSEMMNMVHPTSQNTMNSSPSEIGINPTKQNIVSNMVNSGTVDNSLLNTASQALSSIINPTVQNTNTVLQAGSGFVDNNIMPVSTMAMSMVGKPVIEAEKLITPYSEDIMSAIATPINETNAMVFDTAGNLVKYAGAGANQVVSDIALLKSQSNNLVEGETPDTVMSKNIKSNSMYTSKGDIGALNADNGLLNRPQFENLIGNAQNIVSSKIVTSDGQTLIMWKPQENPDMAKSYPKEKESQLFNKGSKYVTENIPDYLKYGNSDNTTQNDDNNGQSKKIDMSMGNKKDIITTNLNDIAQQYYYNNSNKKSKPTERKRSQSSPNMIRADINKNILNVVNNQQIMPKQRKNRFIPQIVMVNNPQIPSISQNMIMNRKKKQINIPNQPETPQFIYRTPDVNFKIKTATGIGKVAQVGANLDNYISVGKKDIITNSTFDTNLESMLYKPSIKASIKKKIKK